MTRPEFFALEAGEYLERIAILARKAEPEPGNLRRLARALRSAALRGGPPGYAVATGAIETLARRYEEGAIRWTPWLAGQLASAAAQSQNLLRRVRDWSVAEIELCRRIAEALELEDPDDAVVPIEALAPDPEVVDIGELAPDPEPVPIESLAPDRPIVAIRIPELDPIVPIESLLYRDDSEVVPIESLLYRDDPETVPIESLAPGLTPFEQSFSTLYRLVHGRPAAEAPVPIQRLLYRGRRALERADLVRRELSSRPGCAPRSSAPRATSSDR